MSIKIEIVNGLSIKVRYKKEYIRELNYNNVDELKEMVYKWYINIKTRLTKLIRIELDNRNEIGAWELSKQLDLVEEQEEKMNKKKK